MTLPAVRRAGAHEWPELRRLRLEALADEPLAFGSTYEREAAFTDADWERWAADAAAGVTQVLVAATVGSRWVAMARGAVSDHDSGDAYLTAVYVTPTWRRRGLAHAVSAQVIDWARSSSATRILLHVAGWNEAARQTYESLGFVATGATELLPHDPSVVEHEMVLGLR